jgi:teichuronic acid biosynthesis glycosyltransferase TuaG
MNKDSLVSIITPSFNSIKFIGDMIDSVVSQTYDNWELIIVDDCSEDGTFEYLLTIVDKRNITLLRNEQNKGAGFTRNRGLEQAKGRYIAFLDSDDVWLPRKLEKQIKHMEQTNAAISHTSFSFIDENGEMTSGYVKANENVDLIWNLKKTEIGTSTAIIDRSIVGDEFRFPMIRARQDLMLWLELLKQGHNSRGLDESLVLYRIRGGQVSGNKVEMLMKTLKLYLKFDFLPFHKRACYFICYAANAIFKRFKTD